MTRSTSTSSATEMSGLPSACHAFSNVHRLYPLSITVIPRQRPSVATRTLPLLSPKSSGRNANRIAAGSCMKIPSMPVVSTWNRM